MKETVIYALPGFLGLPSDWELFSKEVLDVEAVLPDCGVKALATQTGLWDWAYRFNQTIRLERSFSKQRILMGYSLGGRLAMHALLEDPTLWSGAVLISCHTGLKCPLEKKERLERDCVWAERFEKEPWDALIRAWNSQPIFKGASPIFPRSESEYQRTILASTLRNCSLGRQEDLSRALFELPVPILWMVGERDNSYVNLIKGHFLAQSQIKSSLSQIAIIKNAAHRAPWENFEDFLENFKSFLKSH